jgi:hypothetical protein
MVERFVAEVNIFSSCLRAFMELAQFGDHHFSCYFEVAESLLWSIQHEEAASDIIESCHRVD